MCGVGASGEKAFIVKIGTKHQLLFSESHFFLVVAKLGANSEGTLYIQNANSGHVEEYPF